MLADVARHARERASDGVEQGGGLGRVASSPDDEHDQSDPREELSSETGALAFGSASSHFGSSGNGGGDVPNDTLGAREIATKSPCNSVQKSAIRVQPG
jgi:hypothetical protein